MGEIRVGREKLRVEGNTLGERPPQRGPPAGGGGRASEQRELEGEGKPPLTGLEVRGPRDGERGRRRRDLREGGRIRAEGRGEGRLVRRGQGGGGNEGRD